MDRQQDRWTEGCVDRQRGGQTNRPVGLCQQPSPVFLPFPVQSLPAASCLNFPNCPASPERSQVTPAWEDPSLLMSHECHTCPQLLAWGLRLNLAPGWHPRTHHPFASFAGWEGSTSRRW